MFPLEVPRRKICTLKRFDLNIGHNVEMWGSWKVVLFLDWGPDFVIYLACYYFSCFFQSRKGSFEEMCFLDTLIHQNWGLFKYFKFDIYMHVVITFCEREPTLPSLALVLPLSICCKTLDRAVSTLTCRVCTGQTNNSKTLNFLCLYLLHHSFNEQHLKEFMPTLKLELQEWHTVVVPHIYLDKEPFLLLNLTSHKEIYQ